MVKNERGIESASAEYQERLREGSIERLTPPEKAARDPTSRRLAINAYCWTCQGGGGDPGVLTRIRECPSKRCPLYAVRPYRPKAGGE